jgi:hypothetical protein
VSEETTQGLTEKSSFEERVFARFDALDARLGGVDARLDSMDGRLQVLEGKAYDTKPIWEQALKEIVGTRRELTKRLDRIEAVALETRAGLRDAEDRLEKLENSPAR